MTITNHTRDTLQQIATPTVTSFQVENMLTKSTAMNRVLEVMKKAAVTDANVFIFGESGAGKELIARGIHTLSRRNQNAFIPVDCVALPSNLLESELFGFDKGAFTGAFSKKHGLFELAEQGTFFLDEICELDLMLQAKLLRVLQERQFRRIGGQDLINVDIRVISATNRNPETAVREKILREDLYFRLNVIPIYVPALRERKEDIPLLAAHFIKKFIHANGLGPKELAPETTRLLLEYDWPGNVRELQNIMERMGSLCPRRVILPEDLPACIRTQASNAPVASDPMIQTSGSWRENLSAFKRTYFKKLLEQTHGDIFEAARQAKVSPRTLYRITHNV
jgi:transcriptional regulator with PAS, ATPase and Fis domain